MKVLVYGATGSQMRPLIPQLLQQGHEPFVVSREVGSNARVPSGAHGVGADLADPNRLMAVSRGMDAVAFMLPAFLAQPQNALRYVANAAEAAVSAGVKLMVWNTSGRYPLPGERPGSAKSVKSMHEELLKAGIPLTVVAPAKYMENLLGPWTLQRMPAGKIAYPVLPTRRMGWIACQDVCALIAAALERPQLAGRVFRVSGLEAPTGPELAATFSAVLNRHFEYETLTPQQMKDALESVFGPGSGDGVARDYALDQSDPNPPATHFDMTAVLRELPARMTTLSQFIEEHRSIFDGALRVPSG